MRKWLIGVLLLVLIGAVALIGPYRSERIVGVAENNRTGCVFTVHGNGGWKRDSAPSAWHVERLEDPASAGLAVYGCGGVGKPQPVSMVLVTPAKPEGVEGCKPGPDINWCWVEFPGTFPANDASRRYRVLVRVRAGEAAQPVDLVVTRRVTWRSGFLDALMSV